jgi:sialidase-1
LEASAKSTNISAEKGIYPFPPLEPGCLPTDGQRKIFCPGDAGYNCYRIPSIVHVLGTSTLLAFAEARKYDCADTGFVDLRYRRSTDGGRTWLPSQLLWSNSTGMSSKDRDFNTVGDACPVYDRVTQAVHVVFTRNNKEYWVATSTDQGGSFAPPRNISATTFPANKSVFSGTGHAGGIQLSNGRLLVPAYSGGSFSIMSDDHGKNWYHGRHAVDKDGVPAGGECQAAELDNNRLVLNMRNDGPDILSKDHRLQSYSNDGGVTWSESKLIKDLESPRLGCEGSLIHHPNGKLYFSNPSCHFFGCLLNVDLLRVHMEVKVSEDQGATWKHHVTIWQKSAGYSAMVVLGDAVDSEIGIYYGRNNNTLLGSLVFSAREISFTTFKP